MRSIHHACSLLAAATLIGLATTLAQGCAIEQKKEEKAAEQMPVNCATADGDLRVLRSEKANVVQRIAEGVTMIYPAGAVLGILTGTERTKYQVATGEYNKALDKKIAEIQSQCGVQ